MGQNKKGNRERSIELAEFEELGEAYRLIGNDASRAEFDTKELHERGYYWRYPGLIMQLNISTGDPGLAGIVSPATAGSQVVWLVQYYSTHCGACKDARLYFVEAARVLQRRGAEAGWPPGVVVKVASVNCQVSGVLCSKLHIEFYPSFHVEIPSMGMRHDYYGSLEYNAPVQPPAR